MRFCFLYPLGHRHRLSIVTATIVLALFAPLMVFFFPAHSASAQQIQESPPFDISRVTPPTDPPLAGLGQGSYAENCAPCHGAMGMGDGPTVVDLPSPPTAFADPAAVWERSPAELFHTTKFGRLEKLMPPWQRSLTDGQIWDTVWYAWSLHTNEPQVVEGADLYQESCASCHGESGGGEGADASEEINDFTDLVYTMTRSQADWVDGWQSAHDEIGAEWTQVEQAKTLEYIRTFSYVPPWESSFRPGTGVIRGQVKQGTADGPTLDGTIVALEAYADFRPIEAFTTTVGADGQFEFTDLSLASGIVYLATVPFAGIRYSSPILSLSDEEPSADSIVTVYEPTDDPGGIRISQAHWIMDSQPGAVIAVQIYNIGSDSDRAYIGSTTEGISEPATVALYVPEGAEEINFENGILGERFQQVGNLIYDTTPVLPGDATKQIVVQYALPHNGTSLDLEQEFLYPVSNLNMLVADMPQLEVDVSELVSAGRQDFQGRAYQIWQADGDVPGAISVSLSGLLERGAVDPRSFTDAGGDAANLAKTGVPLLESWMIWLAGGLMVAVLGGVVVWSWRDGRITSSVQSDDLQRQHDDLVKRIAHLDDVHALNDIDDDTWRSERAQLKSKLLDVSLRLSESSTP